jgi:S-adenosyl methyltransferase
MCRACSRADGTAPSSAPSSRKLCSGHSPARRSAHWAAKGNFGRVRTRQEVGRFFERLEMVEPGLVKITDWRPDGRDEEESSRFFGFGGVARKPA